MSIFQSMGNAIGEFLKGVDSGRGASEITRPKMITAGASNARWAGGDTGMQEAAVRRAMVNSWIYTAITRKSMDVSAGKLTIYHNPSGLESEGTPIPGHDLLKKLKRPNPFMGKSFLWQYTQMWLDLNGNSYWFLMPDEDNRWLTEIWPLPAINVNVWPSEDPNVFIDYFTYTIEGREFRINPKNICHFRYPNPFDIYRGLSPLMAAMLPADSDSAMALWNGAFFGKDNVMPSVIINLTSGDPKVPLDPADVQGLKDELTQNYVAGARKTAVTNAYSMAVEQLGWNARDMDFISGRQFTKEEIYQIYGVFPGMMDKNATEANADASRSAYNDLTLWPLFGLYSETIDNQILERFYRNEQEARFEDIRFGNRSQNLAESSGTADLLLIDERRERFWKLGPLPDGAGKKLSTEQAAPAMPVEEPMLDDGLPDEEEVVEDTNLTPDPTMKSLDMLELGLKAALSILEETPRNLKGGQGSGNFGHKGRVGERGGSADDQPGVSHEKVKFVIGKDDDGNSVVLPTHESLSEAGRTIRANGAHEATKITAGSYLFQMNRGGGGDAYFYQQGKFVATVRLGTLSQLEEAVKRSGYTWQGSRDLADTHQVVFDIPGEE